MAVGTRTSNRSLVGVEGALRDAGMRVTRGRLAVYSALARMGGHRSADEVHGALVDRGVQVSRASVFSALEAMTRVGILMAADAGPGRALYEASASWHHHAVCRVCSEVSDVECVVGEKPCLEASGDWGEVDEAQVIFRGVCGRCLRRTRGRSSRRATAMSAPGGRRRSVAQVKGNTERSSAITTVNGQRRRSR